MSTPKKGDTVKFGSTEAQILQTITSGDNASVAKPQYKIRLSNGSVKIVDRNDFK